MHLARLRDGKAALWPPARASVLLLFLLLSSGRYSGGTLYAAHTHAWTCEVGTLDRQPLGEQTKANAVATLMLAPKKGSR